MGSKSTSSDSENGHQSREVLEEVLEALLGAWRGMQREVLLEEGLESVDLDLEQRSNMTGHQGNHLVTFPILKAPLQR